MSLLPLILSLHFSNQKFSQACERLKDGQGFGRFFFNTLGPLYSDAIVLAREAALNDNSNQKKKKKRKRKELIKEASWPPVLFIDKKKNNLTVHVTCQKKIPDKATLVLCVFSVLKIAVLCNYCRCHRKLLTLTSRMSHHLCSLDTWGGSSASSQSLTEVLLHRFIGDMSWAFWFFVFWREKYR